ncbi:MAG: XrtA/PEP-CTERM system TPR-repeat protein PrsT [Thiobacillaceae bacterium]
MNNFAYPASGRRIAGGVLVIALLGAPAFAADRATQASDFYEDALVRMQHNDAKGAIIQLKNALQQDSKMLPALVLLGQAYLKAGQPLGAERVLADAERLGADRSEIIASQVEALHLLARDKELLERFSPDGLPPAVKYKVLVTRAYAQIDIDTEPAAVESAEQARQIEPNNPAALVAQSMAYLRMNNLTDAATVAQLAVARAPADPSAWNMKASIAHARGDFQNALTGYDRALALEPTYLEALIGRASLLLELKRDRDAARDITVLKQSFPDDPRTAYLIALSASRQGNDAEVHAALLAATAALDALPFAAVVRQPQLVLLGGVAHYSLGENEKAKTYLYAYLKRYPEHLGAIKLLTSIMMSEGNYAQAIALLEGPARASPNDPQALSMLASCYMALNQHSKAVSLLEMATQMNGGKLPDITANFGLSLIGSGQVERGIAQLQTAYSQDVGSSRSGVPLALMYMRQGQTKSALQVLQAVMKREPNNVTALNVLALALGLSGDHAGARKTYQAVLAKDPRFTPARLNLARLDLSEGKPDDARARLLGILKDQPRNLDGYFELAQVEISVQRPRDAIRWLEKARSFNPQSLRPNLALVDLYLKMGDAAKALDVAKDAESGNQDNLEALAALGRAYLAVGNVEFAKQNFLRISQVAGFDADWQQRAALLQISAHDFEGARYSLDKALLSQPGYVPALLLKATLEKLAGNLDVAEQQARALATARPRDASVQQLLGDIAMQRKRFSDAILFYRAAYQYEKNSQHAGSLYMAYTESGNLGQALEFAKAWAQSSPTDLTAGLVVAEAYLHLGKLDEAERRYAALSKQLPNNPRVLNELAYIMLERREPGAVPIAERAYGLAPRDASVVDTYGWALVQAGEVDKGLRYLREAQVRAPTDAEIQGHLNEALRRKSQSQRPNG